MDRRSLLTALAGSPLLAAGCTADQPPDDSASDGSPSNQSPSNESAPEGSSDESPSNCGAVEITEASVTVDHGCDAGELRTGTIRGRTERCSAELGLEILDDGETVDEVAVEPTDGRWSVGFGEGPGQIRTVPARGDKRLQVRGPDGEVRAEGTLAVSHYLDSPDLSVWRPQFGPETVAVGEPVTAAFSVATFGAGTSFTAALLVDDEPVDTRDGTVDEGTDCLDASGPTYEFTRAFEEPGEYALAGRVTVDGSGEGGDTESVGTVRVTE